MNCPQCGNENLADAVYCVKCGKQLSGSPMSASARLASGLGEVGKASVEATRELGQAAQQWTNRVGSSLSPGVSTVSMWGPFTGFGRRGRHVAWLLDDVGERAGQLYNAVKARFERREIPDTTITTQTLQLRGVRPDPRPYFLLQRRRATTALYIAQFGKDLYVSQVSYSLGPVSQVRVWAFVLMAAYAVLYTPFLLVGGLGALASGDSGNFFGTMLLFCCGGPLFISSALGVLFGVILAGYRFVTDKDFLAPFRVSASEFDIDDMIALEKAVEQTARECLDEVNVERSLMPEALEYGIRQRLAL